MQHNHLWTLEQIAAWTDGKILSQHQTHFSKVGTDTRQDLTGQIFIALKGDAHDAHAYLDQAVQKKAGLLLVHQLPENIETLKNQVSIVLVSDTLLALQKMAQAHRETLNTQIIAITGSNGKTTTKEFTAAILSQYKKTHFNKGSFNNQWGVPLTLLEIQPDIDFAIVEMGMNHAGEIERLVEIANPNIVVCTMVGTAHIEFFGSQKKIAEAKQEIYLTSSEKTIRIFNQDQDLTFDMMYPAAKKFPAGRMLSFSQKNHEADIYFKLVEINSQGLRIAGSIAAVAGESSISIFGEHNIVNLMAAASLAYAAGMKPEQIWKALTLCQSTWGRNEFIRTTKQVDILFDGYNANPDSMRALIKNLNLIKNTTRKIGVFGQMKELGTHAEALHVELGELVAAVGYDFVFFIGENNKNFEQGLKNKNFKNYIVDNDLTDSMKKSFIEVLQPGDFITIKGSRGARTERFVELCGPIGWKAK